MPDKAEYNNDWSGVDSEMAKTILDRSETYLKAQLDISLAADRRAITLGSVLVTLATGVGGASFARFNNLGDVAVLFAGLSTAAMMVVGAGLSFWSARPILFHTAGIQPLYWWPHRNAPLVEVMGGQSENYQGNIDHNDECLKRNARLLKRSSICAVIAPVLGAIVWFVTHLYLS